MPPHFHPRDLRAVARHIPRQRFWLAVPARISRRASPIAWRSSGLPRSCDVRRFNIWIVPSLQIRCYRALCCGIICLLWITCYRTVRRRHESRQGSDFPASGTQCGVRGIILGNYFAYTAKKLRDNLDTLLIA